MLKWAPAIHEMEKLKTKKKEQEFKEIDSKDLERDYHFNRYLQKKYYIKGFGIDFAQILCFLHFFQYMQFFENSSIF